MDHIKKFEGNDINLIIMVILFAAVHTAITVAKGEYTNKTVLQIGITASVLLAFAVKHIIDVLSYCITYKKTPQKGIKSDLHYRTSRLNVDMKLKELRICCEKYFWNYINRYKQIERPRRIEYVNAIMDDEYFWYESIKGRMKRFIMINFMIMCYGLGAGIYLKSMALFSLILIFMMLVKLFEKTDQGCWHKIVIRFFYAEWGYCLTMAKQRKFVGDVQLVERSKYHKYVHSFLDIAAFCRAVAAEEQMGKDDHKITFLVENLSELAADYTDFEEEKNWVLFLPVWQAALFEFSCTKTISKQAKEVLKTVTNEKNSVEIKLFLQNFWLDMERKGKDSAWAFVESFEAQLAA